MSRLGKKVNHYGAIWVGDEYWEYLTAATVSHHSGLRYVKGFRVKNENTSTLWYIK